MLDALLARLDVSEMRLNDWEMKVERQMTATKFVVLMMRPWVAQLVEQ
jgi:hypothetical protein